MSNLLIVLLSVIPAVVVLLAAVYVLRSTTSAFLQEGRAREGIENRRITLPLRLQAFERMALFLERISPEALLLRIEHEGLDVATFESHLLVAVREEWNHNLSQQIYISAEVWDLIRQAKGNVSQFISLCAERNKGESPAIELSHTMLRALVELPVHPTAQALASLRNEASSTF